MSQKQPPLAAEVIYPESDGKPMAETDVHRDWMVRIIELLQFLFAGQHVYVSGNLLVYYVEGDPKKCVAPDVFVVKGREQRRRRNYKIWQEGIGPCFALEVTSAKTRREDQNKKMRLYQLLGVAEYFLYDPLGDWLQPALQAYRLQDDHYVRLEQAADTSLVSEQLGVTFRLEEGQLALFKTATRERLKTGSERAEESQRLAKVAEDRAARLEAKLARLKAGL
jgi:Uma2 family endonuclease